MRLQLLNTAIMSPDRFNTETSVFVLKGTKVEVIYMRRAQYSTL